MLQANFEWYGWSRRILGKSKKWYQRLVSLSPSGRYVLPKVHDAKACMIMSKFRQLIRREIALLGFNAKVLEIMETCTSQALKRVVWNRKWGSYRNVNEVCDRAWWDSCTDKKIMWDIPAGLAPVWAILSKICHFLSKMFQGANMG